MEYTVVTALDQSIIYAQENGNIDLVEKLTKMKASALKKSESAKKEDVQDIEYKNQILEFMVGKGELRCSTIADHIGVTQSKASALLKKLVQAEQVERYKNGKITYFKIK